MGLLTILIEDGAFSYTKKCREDLLRSLKVIIYSIETGFGNVICKVIKTKSDRESSNFRYHWTKMCPRIILSILRSFLHFLKAKYMSNCLK